jgi:hypothetical protein
MSIKQIGRDFLDYRMSNSLFSLFTIATGASLLTYAAQCNYCMVEEDPRRYFGMGAVVILALLAFLGGVARVLNSTHHNYDEIHEKIIAIIVLVSFVVLLYGPVIYFLNKDIDSQISSPIGRWWTGLLGLLLMSMSAAPLLQQIANVTVGMDTSGNSFSLSGYIPADSTGNICNDN